MNKYKLCRLYIDGRAEVQPINENGDEYGDVLCTFEEDGGVYYAIYENLGDEQDEDWQEYHYFGDDFKGAREMYNKLKEKGD